MSVADPAAAGLPPNAAEQLPDDAPILKRMVLELLASLLEERRDKEALRHRLDLLLRRLYGPRGECFDPDQLLLFAEPVASEDTAAPAADPAGTTEPPRRCRAHCRRRGPAGRGFRSRPRRGGPPDITVLTVTSGGRCKCALIHS